MDYIKQLLHLRNKRAQSAGGVEYTASLPHKCPGYDNK